MIETALTDAPLPEDVAAIAAEALELAGAAAPPTAATAPTAAVPPVPEAPPPPAPPPVEATPSAPSAAAPEAPAAAVEPSELRRYQPLEPQYRPPAPDLPSPPSTSPSPSPPSTSPSPRPPEPTPESATHVVPLPSPADEPLSAADTGVCTLERSATLLRFSAACGDDLVPSANFVLELFRRYQPQTSWYQPVNVNFVDTAIDSAVAPVEDTFSQPITPVIRPVVSPVDHLQNTHERPQTQPERPALDPRPAIPDRPATPAAARTGASSGCPNRAGGRGDVRCTPAGSVRGRAGPAIARPASQRCAAAPAAAGAGLRLAASRGACAGRRVGVGGPSGGLVRRHHCRRRVPRRLCSRSARPAPPAPARAGPATVRVRRLVSGTARIALAAIRAIAGQQPWRPADE